MSAPFFPQSSPILVRTVREKGLLPPSLSAIVSASRTFSHCRFQWPNATITRRLIIQRICSSPPFSSPQALLERVFPRVRKNTRKPSPPSFTPFVSGCRLLRCGSASPKDTRLFLTSLVRSTPLSFPLFFFFSDPVQSDFSSPSSLILFCNSPLPSSFFTSLPSSWYKFLLFQREPFFLSPHPRFADESWFDTRPYTLFEDDLGFC